MYLFYLLYSNLWNSAGIEFCVCWNSRLIVLMLIISQFSTNPFSPVLGELGFNHMIVYVCIYVWNFIYSVAWLSVPSPSICLLYWLCICKQCNYLASCTPCSLWFILAALGHRVSMESLELSYWIYGLILTVLHSVFGILFSRDYYYVYVYPWCIQGYTRRGQRIKLSSSTLM